jgi:hypothetical protein
MKPAIAAAVAVILAGAGRHLDAAGPWVRVETPNFVVFGDAGAGRVRDVAQEFERFREALGRVIPGTGTTAAVPTVVVLFSSERAFEPYRPKFNGKPVTLDGYCLSSDDMNIVALVDGERSEALRRIFHEYVHLAIRNVLPGLPLWLNEGLAEFYSTFTVQDNGRRALVGGLIPAHLHLLAHRKLLPIEELLAVEEESSDYNEGDRRSIFYAQSWALVHMLASGGSARSADLARYLALTSGGTSSRDAWRQVFGDENVNRSLDRYLGQSVMKGAVYRFDSDIPKVAADVFDVTAGDAEAALADLLRRVATDGETTAAFERALARQPVSARARALFGLHAIDNDRYEQGRRLLLAAADSPDWLVQYHVATGLTRLALETAEPDAELAAAARRALARVHAARPGLPHALMMSARLDGSSDGDDTEALATIRRARTLAPGRADYALVESYILTRRGEYMAARELLTPLTGPRFSDNVRGAASRLIAEIAALEQAMRDYIAGLEGRRPATSPSSSSAAGDRGREAATTFRKVAEGERRVEGMLERMDCSGDRIVLDVRTAARLERFAAPAAGVELISYRPDLAGAITCGARQPPDRVYVTLRGADSTPRIVAIEFLK